MPATRRSLRVVAAPVSASPARALAAVEVTPIVKRKAVEISYESDEERDAKLSPFKRSLAAFSPPDNWRLVYDTLHNFRYNQLPPAPVDTMGCDRLMDTECATPPQKRFQILVSLLLSSQTKDPVTAEAVTKLHKHCNSLDGNVGGLSIDGVLQSSDAQLNLCICKVGFHNRKTIYLRQVAEICKRDFGGDIPCDISDLLKLPGVGPKMAYLALQAAWDRVEGIGVDTHVHRISSRLNWVPAGTYDKGPEATRAALESWLPRELWSGVNHLLVGLGQSICFPRTPDCAGCAARTICPYSLASKGKN